MNYVGGWTDGEGCILSVGGLMTRDELCQWMDRRGGMNFVGGWTDGEEGILSVVEPKVRDELCRWMTEGEGRITVFFTSLS